MNDSIFPVRYSQLQPKALKDQLIDRYEFKTPIVCKFFRMGMNDMYLVIADHHNYYLRISMTNMHSLKDYEEEAFIMHSLYQHNISVASPIKCKNGAFVWAITAPEGIRYAILFKEAKSTPSGNEVNRAYNFGLMLSKIHTFADEKNYSVSRNPINFSQLVEVPLKRIESHFITRQEDYNFLKKSMYELANFIEERLTVESPYYGFCHGDIHLSNVCFEGEHPTIFDFDCMGYGWRSHDIAVFLWNHSLANENFIEHDEWKAFLEGYNSIRKLQDNELVAINAFCALRNPWVIGIHTDLNERISGCQMINNNYLTFFLNNFKLWYNRVFK